MTKVYFDYRAPGENLPAMFQNYYEDILHEIEVKIPAQNKEKGPIRRRSRSRASSESWYLLII